MFDIVITEDDFDVTQEYAALRDAAPHAGAIVFFVGLVRDFYHSADLNQDEKALEQTIDHIELQHYAGMTEEVCQQVVDEAHARWCLDGVRVVHRIGKIYASEQIVMVAAASTHRANAFDAVQYIMDYLKTRATLWKKEVGTQGQNWVGQKQTDIAALDRWQINTVNTEKSETEKQ